jgi:small ligand-binding sensory domain FIST
MSAPEFRAACVAGATGAALAADAVAALGALPKGANLGFYYATDEAAQDLPEIIAVLRRRTGIDAWTGTVGLGVCGSAAEIFEIPALSLLVASFPGDSIHVFDAPLAGAAARWAGERQPTTAFVHGDPRRAELPALIGGLAHETPLFLLGGLGAGRGPEGGLSGVLFDPEVEIATALTQGCSPIGPIHRVTAADENVIIEIDDRPALDVLREEMGELLMRDLRRMAGLIFAAFPVPGSDTADYLVRNIIGLDVRTGLLGVASDVVAGDPILFCRRDPVNAMKDLDRMLASLKRRLGNKPPRGGLYVSCIARGPNLFGPDAVELRRVNEALGDFPLAGFFANGEICNDRLYGYTGVLTLFA